MAMTEEIMVQIRAGFGSMPLVTSVCGSAGSGQTKFRLGSLLISMA
jgi:hypothetical protein